MVLRSALAALIFGAALSVAPPSQVKVPPSTQAITYWGNVKPILDAKCVNCHYPGGQSPFPLSTYDDARRHAPTITHMAEIGLMPPWKPLTSFSELAGASTLSTAEIELLARWGATGTKLGKPIHALTGETTANTKWDLQLSPVKPFQLPAEGPDVEVNYVLRIPGNGPVAVQAVEVKPENVQIVRQAVVYLDRDGAQSQRFATGKPYASLQSPGFPPQAFLGSFIPGFALPVLPSGTAMVINPEDRLILHVRYRPIGRIAADRPTILLRLADRTHPKPLEWLLVDDRKLRIPPGFHGAILHYSQVVPKDVTIVTLLPQLHRLGKSIKATAVRPDGTAIPLIFIPNWDYLWQMSYQLVHPVTVPKGSTIRLDLVYNNAADNPANPFDPPQVITYGEDAHGEVGRLLLGFIEP